MRAFALAVACTIAACAADDDTVSDFEQSLADEKGPQAAGPPLGEQDKMGPDDEVIPETAKGPPLQGSPVSQDTLAKQSAYLTAVEAQLPGWIAAGLSEEEIHAKQMDLKRAIMGLDL